MKYPHKAAFHRHQSGETFHAQHFGQLAAAADYRILQAHSGAACPGNKDLSWREVRSRAVAPLTRAV